MKFLSTMDDNDNKDGNANDNIDDNEDDNEDDNKDYKEDDSKDDDHNRTPVFPCLLFMVNL